MYKIKKPEELKKKKKLDYIHLYECFQDMEKKYTDLLYKYDDMKKDNKKKEKEIDDLNNKIIDLELVRDNISIDVDNMRGKTITVIKKTLKDLNRLQKELENKVYQNLIEDTYQESILDNFSLSKKTTEELIEEI